MANNVENDGSDHQSRNNVVDGKLQLRKTALGVFPELLA